MKPKMIATAVLLGFVGLSVGAMVFKEARAREAAAALASTENSPVARRQSGDAAHFVVYYFHGDIRCNTCRAIEAQSHDAIMARFQELIGEGRLEWRLVNYDTPGNAHFRDDFLLSFQSVVLVEENGGKVTRWKNLADVWTNIHQPPQVFEKYVVQSTADFMAAGAP